MNDLSPEGINRTLGRPVWKCWGCKSETGLHWHNGWSVAMCGNHSCAKAYNDMVADQLASEEAYRAHVQEHYGDES